MKPYVIVVVMLCFAISAFAQLEKGNTYLVGQVGGQKLKNDWYGANAVHNHTATIFNANVDYGYLMSSKWAVGAQLNYHHQIDINRFYDPQPYGESYDRSLSNEFSGAIYARRYFSLAPRLYAHIDGGLGCNLELINVTPSGDKFFVTGASLFFNPGASYFVGKRLAITTGLSGLSLGWSKWYGDVQGRSHPFDLKTRPLTVGLTMYLKKKSI